jgi:hypothetical protein
VATESRNSRRNRDASLARRRGTTSGRGADAALVQLRERVVSSDDWSREPYENNLPIVQQPCTGETIQLWYVRYIRNGTMPGGGLRKLYHIVNALTGQCLDDRDGITTNGAYVQQYTCNNTSTTMLWDVGTMTSLGDGRASLKNARSGKCLDIPWASTQPGVAIWQWQCTSTIYSPNYAQIFDVWPPV